ncbi:hypothetical protein [uncultured Dokdonia sp.]|uniref:hypothetical protein n=1 Tax=uncultured Dokdonia sp. TaxID=575653 RepID=UPI00260AA41F|nr:hypothetical protein [uncultured Dokdonia sp.]
MKKTAVFIFEKLKIELFSESLKNEFRASENNFIRIRKQQFSHTLLFMLNMLRKSLSLEIENFVSFLKLKTHQRFTKSAFVQARMKIKSDVFKYLSQTLIKEFGGYDDLDDLEFLLEENVKMNTTNLENLNVLLSSKQKKLITFN